MMLFIGGLLLAFIAGFGVAALCVAARESARELEELEDVVDEFTRRVKTWQRRQTIDGEDFEDWLNEEGYIE